MYITVKQLAEKVNNMERFTPEELNNHKIIKIIVELTDNGKHINYYADTKADRECYTEETVPYSIIHMMNRKRPVYHEKNTDKELFVYD